MGGSDMGETPLMLRAHVKLYNQKPSEVPVFENFLCFQWQEWCYEGQEAQGG